MVFLLIALVVIYIFLEELSRGLTVSDMLKPPVKKRNRIHTRQRDL